MVIGERWYGRLRYTTKPGCQLVDLPTCVLC